MREIKFRGLRVDTNEWVYGYYVPFTYEKYGGDMPTDALGHFIMEKKDDDFQRDEDDFIEVHPESVGQFTGLTDKNGVEVYRGHFLQDANGDIWKVGWSTLDAAFTGTLTREKEWSMYLYAILRNGATIHQLKKGGEE